MARGAGRQHLQCIVSGGGALQPRLARVFWAGRHPVMEGYGLTETSPVIAVSGYEPENNKIGTVGPLIDEVEVKIAADGEILTKSASRDERLLQQARADARSD